MPAVTVLIPTHDHADTLLYSVASVQAQTVQDFELFIVGDGVPERTRALVADLAARDERIRFFDHPKGPRHGEVHRHAALAHARGRIVCYQADDDLWLPRHLETLQELLAEADLAYTLPLQVTATGELVAWFFDATNPRQLDLMRRSRTGFGLASGGHTLEAYRRLPHGWRTTPPGMHTDLHMWLQFLDQPGCRVRFRDEATMLHFAYPPGGAWPLERRLEDLARWSDELRRPAAMARLASAVPAALRRGHGDGAVLLDDRERLLREHETLLAAHRDLLASRSIRLTAPLRGAARLARGVATWVRSRGRGEQGA